MNDYYTDIILQRGEREACDLLVDECRKKDIAIAILKTDLDKERSEAERLRDRQPQGRRGGEMNDHVHDCSKCNGYWPCDRDDCSPDDLCVDCRLEQKDAEIASLKAINAAFEARERALMELICEAAPLAWVGNTQFYDHAVEWDKKARQILDDH